MIVLVLGIVAGLGVLSAAEKPSPALLVVNKQEATLAIVDPATFMLVAKVKTGENPHEVAASADGKLAFVSNYGRGNRGNTISVIDLVTRKERRIDLGELNGIHGIASFDNQAIFASEGARLIGRYNPATGKLERLVSTGQDQTHLVVISKDGARMFASNMDSDNISLIERQGNSWTQTLVAVGTRPEGIDLSPDGKEIWTATQADGNISIVDVATKKVKQTFSSQTQNANRVRFTPDGKLVLISDLSGGDLVIFDAAARKLVKRIRLGLSPEGILIEPSGARAFVAVSDDNQIAVVSLKSLEVIRRFSPGIGPDGMAWAERRQ
jgi:DNA-binding beta-propeller fold protein YncE